MFKKLTIICSAELRREMEDWAVLRSSKGLAAALGLPSFALTCWLSDPDPNSSLPEVYEPLRAFLCYQNHEFEMMQDALRRSARIEGFLCRFHPSDAIQMDMHFFRSGQRDDFHHWHVGFLESGRIVSAGVKLLGSVPYRETETTQSNPAQ